MNLLVLFPDDPPRWLRIDGEAVVERGEGAPPPDPEAQVVGVVPAADVTIHRAALPGLAERQARAAARLLVAENAVAPVDTLHVAIGPEDADGLRTIAAIDSAAMAAHLADFAAQNHDPDAIVPRSLLVARPAAGFVRAVIDLETIVRGLSEAFTDDPALTPLIAPEIRDLDADEIEKGLISAVLAPEVNLRQGNFAKSRRWTLDWPLIRRLARLALLLAAVTLLVELALIVRLNLTANRLETANRSAARAALPPGAEVTDPARQLDARLASIGGGGFSRQAALLAAAVDAQPGAEIANLDFDDAGLRATIRASSPSELALVAQRLTASGLDVAPAPVIVGAGKPSQDFRIRRR